MQFGYKSFVNNNVLLILYLQKDYEQKETIESENLLNIQFIGV